VGGGGDYHWRVSGGKGALALVGGEGVGGNPLPYINIKAD
jgi:hypothetical protein